MHLGAEKITSKVAPGNPAPAKADFPSGKDQNLASVLAPVAGPHPSQ
jgi:hypothetical protein